MFVALYSVTAFVAAFLLFWIEPLAAKVLLPRFGGSPAVWLVSLAFFQTTLLGGYAYAHVTTRWLSPRSQAIVHAVLLALSCARLPIVFQGGGDPGVGARLQLLAMLLKSVGPLFVIIAGTAPMLQRWFASPGNRPSRDPYFLYALSNAGSFAALLSFPFVLEPTMRLATQRNVWSLGVVVLALLLTACAVTMGRASAADVARTSPSDAPITWRDRLLWLALAAAPSSLLLGVTTYVSTDIASVPLLWVVPLALYLGTFVLAFARRQFVSTRQAWWAQTVLVVAVAACGLWDLDVPWEVRIGLHVAAFVATALACHASLSASRPAPARLTEFYLWVALGGAAGGWFNAWISPLIFDSTTEYPLVLALVCLLRPGTWPDRTRRWPSMLDVALPALLFAILADKTELYTPWLLDRTLWVRIVAVAAVGMSVGAGARRPVRLALGVAALLLATIVIPDTGAALHRERNFFGVLKVVNEQPADNDDDFHVLYNGSTVHGAQSLDLARRLKQTTYYHQTGPLGRLFARIGGTPLTRRVAVVGLGTGTIACYGRLGEDWTFFEINAAVERIARDRRLFTFLDDCPPHPKIVVGDARLMLEREADHQFTLILLDAFSSDAIPVHLLTQEALSLYLRKLAPGGLLVFHVSNRYSHLPRVVARTAQTLGLASLLGSDGDEAVEDPGELKWASDWVVVARREDLAVLAGDKNWQAIEPARVGWTDDYSNILEALHW